MTDAERPTPETDEMIEIATCASGRKSEWVNTSFARRLERERDEAREQRDAAVHNHAVIHITCAEAIAERDALRDALEKIQSNDPEENRQHADEIANAALAILDKTNPKP